MLVFVLLSALLVYVFVTGIVMFIDFYYELQVLSATGYAFANTNKCPCEDGGICKLVTNITIPAPLPPLSSSNTMKYCANLVSCVELPWAQQQSNPSSKIVIPSSLSLVGNIVYSNNVIGIVAVDSNACYVAYRGTVYSNELAKDLYYAQTSIIDNNRSTSGKRLAQWYHRNTSHNENNGFSQASLDNEFMVHQGFNDIYQCIHEQVNKYLLQSLRPTLVTTGHSLGAALATLCAFYQKFVPTSPFNNRPITTVTFGEPRVGNTQFATYVDNNVDHLRVVNDTDVFTNVPLAVMPNMSNKRDPYIYTHTQNTHVFNDNVESLLACHKMATYNKHIS